MTGQASETQGMGRWKGFSDPTDRLQVQDATYHNNDRAGSSGGYTYGVKVLLKEVILVIRCYTSCLSTCLPV